MSKDHNVVATITNNTTHTFTYKSHGFIHGKFAEGYSKWPQSIRPNEQITVKCYEDTYPNKRYGCVGWVEYTSSQPHSRSLYFCFSNTDNNGIEVGKNLEEALAAMQSRTVPKQNVYLLTPESGESGQGNYFKVNMKSSNRTADNSTNNAQYTILEADTDLTTAENYRLDDVIGVFQGIRTNGTEVTYINADFDAGLSHFKGVGAYKDKLIFTHSFLGEDHNGVYFIGNKRMPELDPKQDTVNIQAKFGTVHNPKWGHPGGVQVCGSYMAMGLQKSDKGNTESEIQICDIRSTEVFTAMVSPHDDNPHYTALIERMGIQVNGAGMTRSLDGRYIVAASQGKTLSLYRSQANEIKNENNTFDEIVITPAAGEDTTGMEPGVDNFPEDGAGLGLITQANGYIFLITMHAPETGHSTLKLYKITITENEGKAPTATWQRVPGCDMNVDAKTGPLKNSFEPRFRWGKGLSITSPNSIRIYATSRSVSHLAEFHEFRVRSWEGSGSQYLDDESFESPVLGDGENAYAYTPTSSAWTFFRSAGIAGNNSSFTKDNPPAPVGNQVAFIQQQGYMEQTVTLAPGSYAVSFYAAQRANYGSNTFQVWIDGKNNIFECTPKDTNYRRFTTPIFKIAADGDHRIKFQGTNPNGGDTTCFVDMVVFRSVGYLAEPSFEVPVLGDGKFKYEPTSSAWQFGPSAGITANNSKLTIDNPEPAPHGEQVAFLQEQGCMEQTVTLAPGSYVISFYAAQRAGYGSNTLLVKIDGTTIFMNKIEDTNYTHFRTAEFEITSNKQHTIKFAACEQTGKDATCFVDMVILRSA